MLANILYTFSPLLTLQDVLRLPLPLLIELLNALTKEEKKRLKLSAPEVLAAFVLGLTGKEDVYKETLEPDNLKNALKFFGNKS